MKLAKVVIGTCLTLLLALHSSTRAAEAPPWVVYEGGQGPGRGLHIVLISGDEEYRSEEALPALAQILSQRHGFKCTVLFAIDPETGEISPNTNNNIPGLAAVDTADLVILFTRFRDLPDDQMKHIVDYIESGKPIIGLRTATHAFNIPREKTFAKYGNGYDGEDYAGGFGRQVLGEKWISHHGKHKSESTRGVVAPGQANHPILRGIKPGEIWGPTDVYGVRLPLPGDSKPLVLGQVLVGMNPDDEPLEGPKNDPMMPIAWTKTYKGGRVFTTTMGAATDMQSVGVRRMLVNAVYWSLSMEDKIRPDSDVSPVGDFEPTPYGFNGFKKGMQPSDYALTAVQANFVRSPCVKCSSSRKQCPSHKRWVARLRSIFCAGCRSRQWF